MKVIREHVDPEDRSSLESFQASLTKGGGGGSKTDPPSKRAEKCNFHK